MRLLFARLLVGSVFVGLLGLSAGCTPQDAFCPNIGADANGVCPILGDDAMAPITDTGVGGNVCPSGQHLGDDPNGGSTLICLCNGSNATPPCQ
jgi:hypothetical protein